MRPTIYLSVTEDLVTWDTIEIPIDPPEDLHESLHTELNVTGLSLYDNGWLMELTTLTYMNFFALVPDDIGDSAAMARPDFSGAWHDESSGEEGVTIEWSTPENPYIFANTRFVSWDELGTTQALFDKYGPNNQPYPLGELYSGSILVASWGEDPKPLSLPYDAKFSHVVATDAGYLALSDPSEAGYHPGWFGSGTLFFSTDGEEWERIGRLAGEDVWVHSIRGVNGGVVAFGSPSPRSAAFVEDDWMNYYWLGNPDGSSWQQLDIPTYTSLLDWLITHDRAPVGWSGLVVQDNTVLRIQYDASVQTFGSGEPFIGSIRRYVVPDTAEPVSRISAGRLMPWREGFLQVGYPIVDEDQEDRTRLFSRVSADGLDWSPPARLPVPLPDPQIDDVRRWPPGGPALRAASDGDRLIIAVREGEDTLVAVTRDLPSPPPSSEGLPYDRDIRRRSGGCPKGGLHPTPDLHVGGRVRASRALAVIGPDRAGVAVGVHPGPDSLGLEIRMGP